ncbi:MAG: hypothetical protein HY787_16075 [Deltaproteobacteria bacterium]|nr:hypothetical protein [Deltaproteobacteria bacterium]
MSDADWDQSFVRTLGVRLSGEAMGEVDDQGLNIVDDTFTLLLNGHHGALNFRLPGGALSWELVLYTANPDLAETEVKVGPKSEFRLEGRSLALFRSERRKDH